MEPTYTILLHALASYGLWRALAMGEVPVIGTVRDDLMAYSPAFASFILCPLCSGFWLSLALAVVSGHGVRGCVMYGLAGAACVFLIDTQVRRIEER